MKKDGEKKGERVGSGKGVQLDGLEGWKGWREEREDEGQEEA